MSAAPADALAGVSATSPDPRAAVPVASRASPPPVEPERVLELARAVLVAESRAIDALLPRLGEAFVAAVRVLLECRGRVVVSGIGKSGHVARKVAATLASTGTPAFFVHAAEASHGDLGMITADDVVLAFSNSGETDELVALVPHIRRQGATVVAITGNPDSTLAQAAAVHLDATVDGEACPLGLAPSASTTAALALGDALALALLDARGFSADDFARSHPGGTLGRRLLTHVSDVMRTGGALPTVGESATLAEAVLEMSGKGMGMTVVLAADGQVRGIFTDGDLRRCLGHAGDFSRTPVAAFMTRSPKSIRSDALAVDAVEVMERHKVSQLLVIDDRHRLIGALHMLDLLRAKVV